MEERWRREEVGGRYKRTELTSVHEGTMLSKQMDMNIISKEPFLLHPTWWVRVGASAVQAAVCHELFTQLNGKSFWELMSHIQASARALKLHIDHVTPHTFFFLDLNKQKQRGLNFTESFPLQFAHWPQLPDNPISLSMRYALSSWHMQCLKWEIIVKTIDPNLKE